MARWLVEISGDCFDVEEFPLWFPSGDIHSVTENGKVFLVGDTLDAITEASDVHDMAVQQLDEYFEIIRLLVPGLRKPSIGTVFRENNAGVRQGFIFLSSTVTARCKIHATLTDAGEQNLAARKTQTQAQDLLAASRSDKHFQVAISLAANPGATWPHLYRCLEEVEYFLGQKVSDAGICSSSQRERFTRTANSAEVSGRDSRHRLGRFFPPNDPMTISEARSFISQTLLSTFRAAATPK